MKPQEKVEPNQAMKTLNGLLNNSVPQKIIDEARGELFDNGAEGSFLRNNNCWQDLITLCASATMMLRVHAAHSVAARNTNVMSRISDMPKYLKCLRALTVHLKQMGAELVAIKALHADRTGGAQDHEDVTKSLSVFNSYMLFQERHDAILAPTSNILSELVAEAEEKMMADGMAVEIDEFRTKMNEFINKINMVEEPAMTPEQDPTVVTDVETK